MAREVLAESIPSRAYDVHMLLCNMVRLLYNKSLQSLGWSGADVNALVNLAWAHVIAAEEFYGLHICTENLEYSTHLCEDVKRHSSPDNYSCEGFGRAIRNHKRQTHNAKGIEMTFATRANISYFCAAVSWSTVNCQAIRMARNVTLLTWTKCKLQFFFFHESSFEAAKALLNDCSDSGNEHICHAYQNGVVLGKLKKMAIQDHQQADIKRHLQKLHPGTDVFIPTLAQCAKHVVRVNCNGPITKFSQGDICIIAGGPSLTEEWYLKITNIILIGAFMNKYHIFIDGTCYIRAFNQGRVVKHPWTETVELVAHQYDRDTVQFASQLKRKCLLYPESAVKDNHHFTFPLTLMDLLQRPQQSLCIVKKVPMSTFRAQEDRFGLEGSVPRMMRIIKQILSGSLSRVVLAYIPYLVKKILLHGDLF